MVENIAIFLKSVIKIVRSNDVECGLVIIVTIIFTNVILFIRPRYRILISMHNYLGDIKLSNTSDYQNM